MCITRAPWREDLVGQLLDNYDYNYTIIIDCQFRAPWGEGHVGQLLDNYDYNHTIIIDYKFRAPWGEGLAGQAPPRETSIPQKTLAQRGQGWELLNDQ